MDYLQKEDITRINFLTIRHVGGNFVPPANFLHEENLDYLIEAEHTLETVQNWFKQHIQLS